MREYWKTFRTAFPYTIPVLTGYLFIGIAFGVMFREKGYNAWWAAFMSIVVYAGSAQYLAVNFFMPGVSLVQVFFLVFMVNIRHIFYGFTFLEPFKQMGRKKWYMIFSLTDETYSLLYGTRIPEHVDKEKFLFVIALANQLYWITGSVIGSIAGSLLPFNLEGIEFAMTAMFVAAFTEQWIAAKMYLPAVAGIVIAVVCRILFGADQFILPSMVLIMAVLLLVRKRME